jgi:alpha-L-fucosidase 2
VTRAALGGLLAAALTLSAQSTARANCPALDEGRATNYIIPGVREFVFRAAPGAAPLGIDVFAQPVRDVQPTVIVIHGGGWTSGSREAHIGQLLELLTAAGYSWASVEYRLGGPAAIGDAVEDVRAAVEFVRCNAARLRLDGRRLAVVGEDAGAEIAARLARTTSLSGTVMIGGTYDEPAPTPMASPTLVIHGGADRDVPADRAREACRVTHAASAAANDGGSTARCDVDVVDGASHRSENWWPSQWGYKTRLVTWLESVIGQGTSQPLDLRPQPLRDILGPGLHKRIVYNRDRELTLDAWIPPGAGPHVPVLLVHGGGWEAGDRVTYISPLFRPLAEAGFAWFSIDYRLTPAATHDEQEQDVRDAIAFLRQRAGGLNIGVRGLVIVGESASGEMAARIGTEDRGLAGVISFYGVYDFVPMAENLSPRSAVTRLFGITTLDSRARAMLDAHGPQSRVRRDQPPFLLVHGTAEGLWTQGVGMAARLETVGARHELLRLEGAPHGMENWEGQPRWTHYKQAVVEWIRRLAR